MASNVYTKNEILQNLASRGYFIDAYTLGTFFEKWKVEAIFEDEAGSEFYDKNALDLVLNNLFSAKPEPVAKNSPQEEPVALKNPPPKDFQPQMQFQQGFAANQNTAQFSPQMQQMPQQQGQFQPYPQFQQGFQAAQQQQFQPQMQNQPAGENLNIAEGEKLEIIDEELKIEDNAAANILNSISLSDGTPLLDKINETSNFNSIAQSIAQTPEKTEEPSKPPEKKEPEKPGILEGAMQAAGKELPPLPETTVSPEVLPAGDDSADFDDISLLSESLEAQEKFRQYVVSELAKKNVDLNPKSNEFKLDISERTISMIARSMAKKIAKHVNTIFSADAKNAAQLENIKEENKKLEQRTRDLEEQNRKLRLLLAESNKNLNSYKPSIFGLYKKVNPEK